MDGFPASPMQIVAAHMTREEGSYMRDYILDTEGYIESLSFVNIKTKEQAQIPFYVGQKDLKYF